MGNLYKYGIHKNLKPVALFAYIAIDEIGKGLRIHDIEAIVATFLGQNNITVRGEFNQYTKGTPLRNCRYILTKNIGVSIG
ncbi:hypothetical protein [Acetobacter sp. LMG 32666]|uniref:hypothetical protein n=1 Tax=Acetobacter sp. LMG 32666 TaxID=2959295 RepID=UPI0030C7F08A